MTSDKFYIWGRNSVLEALAANKEIEKIIIEYGSHGNTINSIYRNAKTAKIPCVNYDKKKFAELVSKVCQKGEKTQGVIALLTPVTTLTIEELISKSYSESSKPILIALDGIKDPHNLGAIARTALCAGSSGIILSQRESAPLNATAIKASAGALEHIRIAKASNLLKAFEAFKKKGFWIIGTDVEKGELYTKKLYDTPILLVIGSEGRGIRPSVRKHCDLLINIPLSGKLSSLNSSVAAGIILFEIVRQRASL